jgi:hypothetical protein
MALPLVLFLLMLRAPAKPASAPPPFLLDKLRQQGFLDNSNQQGELQLL